MRNDSAATHNDNKLAPEQVALASASQLAPQHIALETQADTRAIVSEVWTGQFPADFTQEELYFMLEVAALFPSERKFVALLGGDAAQVWDVEPDDEAESPAVSLEERMTASVFERLKLPAPTPAPRKSKK